MTTKDIKLIDDILTEVSNSIAVGELEEMEIGEYYQEVLRRYNEIKTDTMEQKELTAQEIVEKLIDEKKISGKEAVILLNAINKPAEVRIEKEYTPYTPYIPNTTPWYQSLDAREPKCYEPGGTCTNPHKDCINCPRFMKENYSDSNITYTAATREIPNPVEPMMKEE